jgi:hypothetical protein
MGGGKKQPTQQVIYKTNTRLMNMFSVLAETDSEEEVVEEAVVEEVSDSSYSEEEVVPAPVESQSPQFRIWKDDSRFSSMKNNVFSSPFSRKKPRRYTKEEEWTSIQVGTAGISPTYSPLTQPSESQNDVPQLNLPPAVFPSLLSRGTSAGVSADDVSEEQTALAWAEKVKQTLERAGQGRSEMKRASAKSDDGGNISFFRRSIVLDEKF